MSMQGLMPDARSTVLAFWKSAMRAELGIDRAVVHHRVAAVVRTGAGFQAGHHVGVGDAEVLQIVDMGGDVAQPPGELVDVEDVADHLLSEEPVGVQVTLQIEAPQVSGRSFQCRCTQGTRPLEQEVHVDPASA